MQEINSWEILINTVLGYLPLLKKSFSEES